jgi:hypothetical protein
MMKSTLFALLGLAAVLTLASPPKANAAVVIGVGVGPVYHRPAYGYVVVPPRPYFYHAHPYAYAPAYVPRVDFYAGHSYGDRHWANGGWDYRTRRDYRGWRR